MKKILIGLPTNNFMGYQFVNSFVGMLMKTMSHYGKDIVFEQYFIDGVRTDKNRNQIVQRFLKSDFDAILFLDTDMVYPDDMLIKYIESGKDLIGGVYYKRTYPHYPVVYMASGDHGKPFNTVDPTFWGHDRVVEVDGLGTGGMFITRKVFDKIKESGQEIWFKYGDNYHLPFETSAQTTHDLIFCKKAKDAGVEVYLHTGVQMGHMSEEMVTQDNWLADRKNEAVEAGGLVEIIMPVYGENSYDIMLQTLASFENETDYENYIVKVIIDGDEKLKKKIFDAKLEYKNTQFIYSDRNQGWANTVNEAIKTSEANYFVYVGNDVLLGRGWLTKSMQALKEAFPERDGVVVFNDGKWDGQNASHALVTRKFIERYCGDTLFYPGYFHYHADRELTQVALMYNRLVYVAGAVMYHLQSKNKRSEVNEGTQRAKSRATEDLQTYSQRERDGFPLH